MSEGSSKVVPGSDLPPDQTMSVSAAIELIELMPRDDAEPLEKLSKKVEEYEKQRTTDLEAAAKGFKRLEKIKEDAEKQRTTNLEASAKEIKRLEKDAEKQRKKNLENAEKQRKKDLEAAAQKFKQIKKGREDLEKRLTQLKTNSDKFKEENEKLNNRFSEYELKQQRRMDYLAEGLNAAMDFLTSGDTLALDRVKRRNLLDNAQIRLAHHLGIAAEAGDYVSSLTFRNALGPSTVHAERRRQLVRMIEEKAGLPEEVARLTQPEHSAALDLLVEYAPQVRMQGNELVHASPHLEWYMDSIGQEIPTGRTALSTLLDLVCVPAPAPAAPAPAPA